MAEKQVKDYDKFNLRFPDGMRDAIAERAKRNGRSMNSEIVQIIQDALDLESSVTTADDIELHATALSKIESQEERDKFVKDLANKDAFAALLLKEQEEYHKRMTRILVEHLSKNLDK
ncbi:TPA: Arc family DNA-binding protein [Klebsiella pneumoniae]|nr:Arc family DNA-binding protein [Klebsiella pneumoniae]